MVIRGLYTATSGMMIQAEKQQVLTNDLANVNTTGYKRDVVRSDTFKEVLLHRKDSSGQSLIGTLGLGNSNKETVTLFEQGALKATERELDLALMGEGFYVIQSRGQEVYTRDGSFSKDSQGRLVTSNGDYVLGEKGIVTLSDEPVTIDSQGTIWQGNTQIDKLRVVSFEDSSQLEKQGNSLFVNKGSAVSQADATVRQGFLEGSNVDLVSAMVDLMAVMRAYETGQKVIQIQDETLGLAVKEVGKV